MPSPPSLRMSFDGKQTPDVHSPVELNTLEGSPEMTQEAETESLQIVHSTGWRVYCIALGISLAVGAVQMEVTILGTSLVKIVEDLKGFDKQGWVVTGYLITYTSLIVIWSKLSAVIGRKTANIASITLFTAFSGGCGASQTIDQLIINRVFQGVGAAGVMSCGVTTIYELVPHNRYPSFAAAITAVSALGAAIGPLIGGALSEAGAWRWVFLINVPLGGLLIILFILAIPTNFPYHNVTGYSAPTWAGTFSAASLARLDVTGCGLLLSGSVLLVTAILQGGTQWDWNSSTSIALFIVAGVLCIFFAVNEYIVSKETRRQEPLFPSQWMKNRVWLAVLLTSTLASVPYNTLTISLPQRFQIVEGDSPFRAGARLIPFNFFVAFGGILTNVIAKAFKVPPIFLCFFGTIIESIGVGLLATLPRSGPSPGVVYLYQILAGLGTGFIWGMVIVIPPFLVRSQDKDISGGAIFQTRVFGGAVGLAIASTVLNNYLSNHLKSLSGSVDALLADPTETLKHLPEAARQRALETFADGYNLDVKIMAAFAAAQILTVALMWKSPQVSIIEPTEEKDEHKEKLHQRKESQQEPQPT